MHSTTCHGSLFQRSHFPLLLATNYCCEHSFLFIWRQIYHTYVSGGLHNIYAHCMELMMKKSGNTASHLKVMLSSMVYRLLKRATPSSQVPHVSWGWITCSHDLWQGYPILSCIFLYYAYFAEFTILIECSLVLHYANCLSSSLLQLLASPHTMLLTLAYKIWEEITSSL